MVRRLKSDLRHFGERFPERAIVPIPIADLPDDAADLLLPRQLAAYGERLRARAASLPPHEAGLAKLAFVGLQQRLLSSPAAFAATLEVHLKGLDRKQAVSATTAEAFTMGASTESEEPEVEQEASLAMERDEDAAAEAAAKYAAPVSDRDAVVAMLEIARAAARKPDARVIWLAGWIRTHMAPHGTWNQRRLVIFTEWEATRRWLERRLAEALDDLSPDDRIANSPASRRSTDVRT